MGYSSKWEMTVFEIGRLGTCIHIIPLPQPILVQHSDKLMHGLQEGLFLSEAHIKQTPYIILSERIDHFV